MVSPQFIEDQPLSLIDVKAALAAMEQRDNELNFQSNKAKEYVATFVELSPSKKEELYQKLKGLELTRIKEEHLMKIIDFLPKTVNELKIVLQAYPLSMPKKDQDSIVAAVNEFLK